ncbi:MAG: cyclodeaminase/cyclohydrolase family protein, partial [Elusimicrobiota bacterium]
NEADTVIVTDVYAAGEQPIEGASRDALIEGLKRHGHKDARALDKPEMLASVIATLAKDKALKQSDLAQGVSPYDDVLSDAVVYLDRFLKSSLENAAAHEEVLRSFGLPRQDEYRQTAIDKAFERAGRVPTDALGLGIEALNTLGGRMEAIHPKLASDYKIAMHILFGACLGMHENAMVHLETIRDEKARFEMGARCEAMMSALKDRFLRVV